MKTSLYLLPLVVLMISCGEESNKTLDQSDSNNNEQAKPELTAGIKPPAPSVNVPFMEKKISAEQGGAFVYETGSIITFPQNAVLHADGTPVSGEFDVIYREFHDPIDIFFSGIPMEYDSAGVQYDFISAGMCEMKAYQNGEELIVNPAANPNVSMVSKDADPAHNLYYYDESKNSWVNNGKPNVEAFKDPEEKPAEISLPIKPKKIDPQKNSFFISVEELGSEFAGFDKMYFQIADEEKNYNPSDAGIQWYSVDVKKSSKMKGKYLVTFANTSTSRTYITDPVFSDKDYDKAMLTYNKVITEKAEAIKKQEEELAAWEAKQAAIIAQNTVVDSINAVIEMRNKEIIAYNEKMINAGEMNKLDMVSFRDAAFAQNGYSITRGFDIEGFGVWNCDNPAVNQPGVVDTKVTYKNDELKNSSDNIMDWMGNKVIYKSRNSLMAFDTKTFKNIPGSSEIIMIVKGDKLFYGEIKSDSKLIDVFMHQIDLSNTSFNDVKKKLMGA